MRTLRIVLLALLALVLLAGCVPGDGKHNTGNPAGFLWGLWHGIIAVITLIWGLFNHSVRIYEVHNTGWWYDLGFLLPWIMGFAIGAGKRGHCK